MKPHTSTKAGERAQVGEHGDTPEEREQAERLATLLWDYLKKDSEHSDRRQTAWGTKTKLGLLRTVQAAIKGA